MVDVREAIGELVDLDLDVAELERVRQGLARSARVRSWLDAWDVAARRRLDDLAKSGFAVSPDRDVEQHGRTSRRDANRVARRQGALDLVPELADPLAAGEVSGAHVDALANGLGQLDAKDRDRLAGERGRELAELAKQQSPDEFDKTVKQAVADAQSDGGVGRLERQKRAIRLRAWWDQITGMLQVAGQLDPETGMRLLAKLRHTVEQLFHDRTPECCPEDPSAKQDYLMALALVALVEGNTAPADGDAGSVADGGSNINIDFVLVMDEQTLRSGLHQHSIIDLGHPETFLPVETLRRMACSANIIPAVMSSHGVVLDLGYSVRLATKAQRRAMRAMYPSCGVPGCRVPFEQCVIHHIRYWENFGTTDMANMIPLCSRHHHAAHEGGWQLSLDPTTRALTITYPEGTTNTSAAPRARAPAA